MFRLEGIKVRCVVISLEFSNFQFGDIFTLCNFGHVKSV